MVGEPMERAEVESAPTAPTQSWIPASLDGARRLRLALKTHPNLKDKVVFFLRSEILAGRLAPAQKIDQQRVSRLLGMSRLPVREALIELAQEGVIESIPRRGSFVARISEEDILDQYLVQGMIAGLAARRAASRLTAQQLARLHVLHDEFVRTADGQQQADISYTFHAIIVETGSSSRLLSILQILFRSLPTDYFDVTPGQQAQITETRRQLLDALVARDADSAAHYQMQLWTEIGESTVELLRNRGLWGAAPD